MCVLIYEINQPNKGLMHFASLIAQTKNKHNQKCMFRNHTMTKRKRLLRQASSYQPDSPATIKLKKLEQSAVKQQAFKDLLELKRKNGGSNAYGDFEKVKQKYHLKGFTYVTVDNLHYRMNNLFKSGNTNLRREIDKPTVILDVDTDVCDGISPLTVDVVEDVEKPPREEVIKNHLDDQKGQPMKLEPIEIL